MEILSGNFMSSPTDISEPVAKQKSRVSKWLQGYGLGLIALPLGTVLLIGIWHLVTKVGEYPTFILPDPLSVFIELKRITLNGILWMHIKATLQEMAGGLLLGLGVATVLGYFLAMDMGKSSPNTRTENSTISRVNTEMGTNRVMPEAL